MAGIGSRQAPGQAGGPRRRRRAGIPSVCPHCGGRGIFAEGKGWYCINCGYDQPGDDIGELEWMSRAAREHGGESGIARLGRLD